MLLPGAQRVELLLLSPLEGVVLDRTLALVREQLQSSVVVHRSERASPARGDDRGQRRADAIVADQVAPQRREGLGVGLLAEDVSVPGLNFVFGLADAHLGAAVVSWYRLRSPDSELWAVRLAKEVVHEVGHLRGLAHCSDAHCVMHFSNMLVDTDAKGAQYCARCATRLARLSAKEEVP